MEKLRVFRYVVIALLLLAGAIWSVAAAQEEQAGYPTDILVDAAWLHDHLSDKDMVVLDVRSDKRFDNRVIPGAARLRWRGLRMNDPARGLGGVFVGTVQAQEIFGQHGVARTDVVVLYDDVERDGGATASYVFWALDVLGHKDVRILDRGVDAWVEAGYEIVDKPREPEPVLYQAPTSEIRLRRLVDGDFIYKRLADPYYQVVDTRSRAEYLGQKPNKALDGSLLKPGHIPTAVNVPYSANWADEKTKAVKSYAELRELYRGLDPGKGVVIYCHSARRGSFGYFILRLMGFRDVMLYDNSWFEWGAPQYFFPVEDRENRLAGPQPAASAATTATPTPAAPSSPSGDGGSSNDGYVSCGG